MFVIDCLPFSKGLKKDNLSYFSSEYVTPGSLIKITVRNQKLSALVIDSKDARERKAEIKSADFKLSKISSLVSKPFLSKEFLSAVQETSSFFSANEGSILSQLIPASFLENPSLITSKKKNISFNTEEKKKADVLAIQSEEDDRMSNYRLLIREEFAKNKSVFFCIPQNESILNLKKELSRGIDSYICTFHKDMSKKEFKEEWERANDSSHPVVIIGTSKWLFIEREDLGAIVLENENKNGWKTLFRPFVDMRFLIEKYAEKRRVRIIFGDLVLRLETLSRYKQGEILSFENVKWRISEDVETRVIDMKKDLKKSSEFRSVSLELLESIKENIENKSNMFIFSSRKGFSSNIICRDCGEEVKCFNCESPMVLYKKKNPDGGEENIFRCHQCDERRDALEHCQKCHSWRLEAFGSGIERVVEEIKKVLPGIALYELSSDTATSSNKASIIVNNFYENRGAVLIGTEMALPYLHKKVSSTAIASFDSLFSVPDFRIGEKIFSIILETKSLAKTRFFIQTRNTEDEYVKSAMSGNVNKFYEDELGDRRALGYPPFGIFIKITVRGQRNLVQKESEKLKKYFSEYDSSFFSSLHEKKGEASCFNAVIKVKKEEWPDPEISSILKSLPPHFEIKVDPDNLL